MLSTSVLGTAHSQLNELLLSERHWAADDAQLGHSGVLQLAIQLEVLRVPQYDTKHHIKTPNDMSASA
jgi:hypothetical protein